MGTIILLHDIVEFFFKNYNFGWILKDVRKNLVQELNFVNEGKNLERCANDLKAFSFVYIPKVYWSLTTTVIENNFIFRHLRLAKVAFTLLESPNLRMDRWHKNW